MKLQLSLILASTLVATAGFASQVKKSRKLTAQTSLSLANDSTVMNSSSASQSSVYKIENSKFNSMQGLRLSIIKPSVEVEFKASQRGESGSDSDKVDDAFGFSIGYAKLPIQQLGYLANVNYFNYHDSRWSANLLRVDVSFGYAFNDKINLKAGFNMSKFTDGQYFEDLDPAFGAQVGANYRLTQIVGVEMSYVRMNQSGIIEGVSYDLNQTGFEMSLNVMY